MKLFWGPHTCAIELAALMEEGDLRFERVRVDTAAGEQNEAAFRAINPKGKVPVLMRDDGSVLTEFPAIAHWVARLASGARLWPNDPEAALGAAQMMDFAIGTIHGYGFRRIFFPHEFCKDEAHRSAVKADGRVIAAEGFAILADQLGGRPYAAGAFFTIADAPIAYCVRWARLAKVPVPASITALADRVHGRPAFRAAYDTMV